MSPEQNTSWQTRVREMLGRGLGVEDIAVKLGCDANAVRHEIRIYREEGTLLDVLGVQCIARE